MGIAGGAIHTNEAGMDVTETMAVGSMTETMIVAGMAGVARQLVTIGLALPLPVGTRANRVAGLDFFCCSP
jgi:hypothetical protein